MAADQALLTAYRGAQAAGVPQSDPMGDAFAEMQESLSKVHERIQAQKEAKAELDFEKEKAGWTQDAAGNYHKTKEEAKKASDEIIDKEKAKGQKVKDRRKKWKDRWGKVKDVFKGNEEDPGEDKPGEDNPNENNSPTTYRSPFHFNGGNASEEEIAANAIQQQQALSEVFASKEWKDEKRKELDNLTAGATGLTQPMFEQQQIVITKAKEDNFGDNKWKMIQETVGDPLKLAELVQSGVLGDEQNAAQILDEYQKHSSLGLTPDTIYKNKQGEARAKITNLASQNENHKEAIETLKQAYQGTAGKLSNYIDYDLDSEFYNKTTAFLNPKNPVELQESGEFVVKSPFGGEQGLTANTIDSLVTSNLVDTQGQISVQQAVEKFGIMGLKDGESPKPKNSLPSDEELMGSAQALIDKAENFNSWMHDDILGNNSSFAKDIEDHPEFKQVANSLDPTKDTHLTYEDLQVVKDAIVNPKNPFYDEKRSKELMKNYIVEKQKQTYKKNNTSFEKPKKRQTKDADSILNKYGIDPKLYK